MVSSSLVRRLLKIISIFNPLDGEPIMYLPLKQTYISYYENQIIYGLQKLKLINNYLLAVF